MPRAFLISIISAVLTAVSFTASASDWGSSNEARAMLDRAAAEMRLDKQTAITKFNHNDSQFRDRDLFVFCFNRADGKFTAHEAFVSWDVRDLHDWWGDPFGQRLYLLAEEGKVAEVTYYSPKPGFTTLATKISYVTVVGDQACGVSAYTDREVPRTH